MVRVHVDNCLTSSKETGRENNRTLGLGTLTSSQQTVPPCVPCGFDSQILLHSLCSTNHQRLGRHVTRPPPRLSSAWRTVPCSTSSRSSSWSSSPRESQGEGVPCWCRSSPPWHCPGRCPSSPAPSAAMPAATLGRPAHPAQPGRSYPPAPGPARLPHSRHPHRSECP